MQSLIAIGRGEWFGVGLGASVQKLFYLPEAHTDFVFAVLAEEFGFVGVRGRDRAVRAARGTRAAAFRAKPPRPGRRSSRTSRPAIGIWLGLQTFVNIGVNMGLLPTKGLTLPLLQLRRQQHAGHARLDRRAAADPSRDAVERPRLRVAARGAARMTRKVALVMAGGTGGHVFPALATARVLQRRGFDIVWLGTQRGIEARLVPAAGIPVEWLSVSGLRGKGVLTLLAAPFRLVRRDRRRRCARSASTSPRVVLGAGGFASGPGGIAAWLLRRPLVVHEQNAVAGLTNRVLARLADARARRLSRQLRQARERRSASAIPVRPEIVAIAAPERRYRRPRRPPCACSCSAAARARRA